MKKLYPLKLRSHPCFLRFGGVKLVVRAHTVPDPGEQEHPLAETWEISDHPSHSSIVTNGTLRGKSLRTLMEKNSAEFLGETQPLRDGRFPLMVRLLDISESLPPAVHCDNEYVASNNLPEYGKHEAAYVIEADEGAKFYAGNKQDLNKRDLDAFVKQGRSFETMHSINVKPGDTYYIPSGRLHSWGKGNLIYEVHTTSNNIFALDWLSWDKDQERRDSDVRKLKECLVLDAHENSPIPSQQMEKQHGYSREILCSTRFFILEKLSVSKEVSLTDFANRFYIYTIIDGKGEMITEDNRYSFESYETALIPAASMSSRFVPSGPCTLLKAYIGDLQKDVVAPLSERKVGKDKIICLAGFADENDLKDFV